MSSDNQAPDQESTGSETEVDTTSKPAPVAKRRGIGDTFSNIGSLFILITTGVAGIVATISGHFNSYVSSDNFTHIYILAFTIVATAWLTWYVFFEYNSADPIRRQLVMLGVAVSVNIFLAISVWTVIVSYIHPAVSPQKVGLMVWWNLSDAIPLINVNSVLDWQQPLTGYSVQVGWLFLLQRVVVILTLLRVIQLLVARWVGSSKAETKTEATEAARAEPPTDHSGNHEP
jgi:hypothetical protein